MTKPPKGWRWLRKGQQVKQYDKVLDVDNTFVRLLKGEVGVIAINHL